MKLFKFIAPGMVALLSTIAINAQNDSTLNFSLLDAQNYAIDNYYLSLNAAKDIESAEKKIWETTAIGLPQVSTNGEYQRYLDDEIPSMTFPDFENSPDPTNPELMDIAIFQRENFSYGGNVSQLIFSGEYIVGLQASKVYKLLSEENYEKIKIDLRETIAGTYYTLLILAENKRVITETLDNLYMNLEHSRKTFEVGLIEDIDVDQLELTVKRTENDLKSIDNQIETMNRMLKYQLGLSSSVNVILTDNLTELLAVNIISDSAYTFILEDHIDYRMLATQENLQELSLNREKTKYLPEINGFYNYMGNTNASAFTPPQHLVGVKANWTIFQSGLRSAKIAQEKIALEQAQNVKEQESERLILVAQQAKYDYQTALARYLNEETNFELSKKVFDKTTKRYKEGFVSSLDLSIVNNQYLGAQLSFAIAIQDLLTTKVALDKAYSRL